MKNIKKVFSKSQMAEMYKVDRRTFLKMLEKKGYKVDKNKRLFTIKEVAEIFNLLGTPTNIDY